MGEADVVKDYETSLSELTFNSKPHINLLTLLADEGRAYAADIVKVIEARVMQVEPSCKLALLYLIDSILKNCQNSPYKEHFAKNIINTFVHVFDKGDEKVRQSMFKLRNTWVNIFPISKLYAIDIKVHAIDPAWPLTVSDTVRGPTTTSNSAIPSPPTPTVSRATSIHVNPKFLANKQPLSVANVAKSSVAPSLKEKTSVSDPRQKTLQLLQQQKIQLCNQKSRDSTAQEQQQQQGLVRKEIVPKSQTIRPVNTTLLTAVTDGRQPKVTANQNQGGRLNRSRSHDMARDNKRVVIDITESSISSAHDNSSVISKPCVDNSLKSDYSRNLVGEKSSLKTAAANVLETKKTKAPSDLVSSQAAASSTSTSLPVPPKKPSSAPPASISQVACVGPNKWRAKDDAPEVVADPRPSTKKHKSLTPIDQPPVQISADLKNGKERTPPAPTPRTSVAQQLQVQASPSVRTIDLESGLEEEDDEEDEVGIVHTKKASALQPSASGRKIAADVEKRARNTIPTSKYSAEKGGSIHKRGALDGDFRSKAAQSGRAPTTSHRSLHPAKRKRNGVDDIATSDADMPRGKKASAMTAPMYSRSRPEPIPANNCIFVDGNAYIVSYVNETPVIKRDGLLHRLQFVGRGREVTIDNCTYYLRFDQQLDVVIDGHSHRIRFGGPSRELYMGDYPFRGTFGGPPIFATINGVKHKIQLRGPAPEVKIDPEPAYDLMKLEVEQKTNKWSTVEGRTASRTYSRIPQASLSSRPAQPVLKNDPMPSPKRQPLLSDPIRVTAAPVVTFTPVAQFQQATIPPQSGLTPYGVIPSQSVRFPIVAASPAGSVAALPRIAGESSSIAVTVPTTAVSGSIVAGFAPATGLPSVTVPTATVAGTSVSLAVTACGTCTTVPTTASVFVPAPTSGVPQSTAVNVNELLTRLVSTGIIGLKPSAAAEPKKITDAAPHGTSRTVYEIDTTIPTSREPTAALQSFEMRGLRVRYTSVIEALYKQSRLLCSHCGMRFMDTDQQKYAKHLDYHFKQNRLEKMPGKQSRMWHIASEDWVSFEEYGDENTSKPKSTVFETAQKKTEPVNKTILASTNSVITALKEEYNECSVCQEKFEQFWDEDEEAWKLCS